MLWLAGFLLFTLYPIWATLYFNFTNRNVPSALHWVRLPNYASLLADRDDFWKSVGNTVCIIPIAWSEFTNRVYSCLPYTQEDYLCADENS